MGFEIQVLALIRAAVEVLKRWAMLVSVSPGATVYVCDVCAPVPPVEGMPGLLELPELFELPDEFPLDELLPEGRVMTQPGKIRFGLLIQGLTLTIA